VYAAKNAVVRYNQGLVEAFRASRADLLTQVATENEVSRVSALIAGLATRGQYMEARQTAFEVKHTEVLRAPDGGVAGAKVDADETWAYEHRALAARDAPSEVKTASYRLSYLLERKEQGWLVGQVLDRERSLGGSGP